MATIFIEKAGIELEVERGCVVLRRDGQLLQRVPCLLIDRVVVIADVALRGSVVRGLATEGIGLYWPGTRRGHGAMTWPADRQMGERRLAQARVYWNASQRQRLAGLVVRGKLLGQLQVLRWLAEQRPEKRFELGKARQHLSGSIGRLRTEAMPVPSLLGVEGAASAAYFEGMRTTLAGALQFAGRNRRPPRDPVNAALSLGYTLLYAAALEAILAAGLEPSYGFLHEPAPGRSALACDLMEPFRPAIDQSVLSLFHSRVLRQEGFSMNQGACLMGKAARRTFYSEMENRMELVRRRLRKVASTFGRSLMRAANAAETVEAQGPDEGDFE